MRIVITIFILVFVSLSIIELIFPVQSFAAIDPSTCVGAWFFEEGTGPIAKDFSGNGNDGTIEGGPKWGKGKFGKSLDFDGTDDHIIVPDSPGLDLNHLTVTAWINLRSYPDDARIITKEFGVVDPYSVYTLLMSGDGERKLEFRPVLDNQRKRIPSNADIPLNQWIHVAATFDGRQVVLYINGDIDKTEQHAGMMLENDEPVYLGASQFWDPRFFDGLMDEAALFNAALSEDDIKSLMAEGLAKKLPVSSQGRITAIWAQLKR
jgi:hypothetical protein